MNKTKLATLFFQLNYKIRIKLKKAFENDFNHFSV